MHTSGLHIDPGMAPDGLVFRITRGDGVIVWFEPVDAMDAIPDAEMLAIVDRHRQIAYDLTETGFPSQLHIFDGNTGACTAAFWFIASEDL